MNILGLHFGHDAAVSVIKDGRVAAYVLRERHTRVKHAISLEFKNIEAALAAAQLRWDQIDYCAITSTQSVELIIDDGEQFSINFKPHPRHAAPCTTLQTSREMQIDPRSRLVCSLMQIFYDPALRDSFQYRHYGPSFPEYRSRTARDFTKFDWMDQYIASGLWTGGGLADIASSDFSPLLGNELIRHGFHFPVTVTLAGHAIAGYFIAHHSAHAASTYYQSGFSDAAILTHDGMSNGATYLGGMFYWGEGHRIYPITPHHLMLGALYECVGVRVGLGDLGAPGKLMGLAGYGKPQFFDRRFVGNWFDWKRQNITPATWWEHCLRSAATMGYDLTPLCDRNEMTAPVNADIAASTQLLFEETFLTAVEALHKVLARAGRRSPNLCLSGGTALNCPANSRLFRESQYSKLFIEPGCDDSGLAIGAALFLYHNVLDQPLRPRPPLALANPYLGLEISRDAIQAAFQENQDEIAFERCDDAALRTAEDLAEDCVVGWFEGRSEIGPRALGHRSILADARAGSNWQRVNQIKGRESWRPFAPAVLESQAAKWFAGGPIPSPYMLFTATVRNDQLPAITHRDGTARIQTVSPANGEFFRVIEKFFHLTGVPVILNTSFNGLGEPIVETPADAIRFLAMSNLDALYIDGFRVTRRRGTSEVVRERHAESEAVSC